MGLTPRQAELLAYVQGYIGERGYAPGFAEMMEAIGVRSTARIHWLLTAIEERGYIRRLPKRARAIEIIRPLPSKRPIRLAVIYTEADLDARAARKRASYAAEQTALCWGCPPVGYPTDKTRCDPCPRRQSEAA